MNIKKIRQYTFFLSIVAVVVIMAGCSTAKNTSRSRWWHAFNARYNTYYNGSLAYIDGSLEKETGNKDNYTEIIPLYTVGNKASRELGKANFDRAILKAEKAIKLHSIKRKPEWNKSRRKTARDIEWLSRREYNPFLWKVWMLMGRSQFHEGDFDGAASTFSYMSRLYETQPAIYARARAWLAKCYVESDYLYDAEDVIRNMQRDSIHWRAQKEWDYTFADYYIHTKEYDKAVPYLRRVIKHEMRRRQKAREWYLMGQLCQALGRNREAYKAYQHTIRLNPPYELEFNARIQQTEVLAEGQSKKMIGKLRRMARSDNNKDYLDQVYYAIGNIYLAQNDTAHAISAYETGNAKATRSGIEKGVLLLKLGDLYWDKESYKDAQRCYGEAIGLLDKERPDYEQLSNRSKVLDELVPYTEAVHLQDSLQNLARMDEPERNAAIDRVIAALKKKEREEQRAKDEQTAQEALQNNQSRGDENNNNIAKNNPALRNNTQQSSAWYFYNPLAVQQGKQLFQRKWGKRENVDDWQRVNKTVVDGLNFDQSGVEEYTDEQRDSMFAAQEKEDSLKQISDSAQNDPHRREYYLAQIPFTEEQMAASNATLMDGLYHSGVIFKDKLDNLPLSEKALRRLSDHYPTYEHMDDVFYHLYLLYSRKGEPEVASQYLDSLKMKYPKSQWTTLLSDPNYTQNAREGVHLEDSLYAATYEAFKADRFDEIESNARISENRFPLGANRDKFIFIGALGKLNNGNGDACLKDLNTLVEKYPTSQLSPLAGMIINGVKEGRRLRGGKFDLGDVWARRTVETTDSAQMSQKKFSNERNTNFVFMLVYKPDSVNENKLLYQLARFNFTSFLVRDFDINVDGDDGLHRMSVSGFRSYDEALQYARQLLSQQSLLRYIGKARPIIISEENLPLLGTAYSYDDYSKFYNRHFAPLKISTYHLLTEPAEVVTEPEPQEENNEDEQTNQENGTYLEPTETDVDNFLNDTFVGIDEPTTHQPSTTVVTEPEESATPTGGATIPVEEPVVPQLQTASPQLPVVVPRTETTPRQQMVTPSTVSVPQPVEKPHVVTPRPVVAPSAPQSVQQQQTTVVEQPIQSGGTDIILDDDELPVRPRTSTANSVVKGSQSQKKVNNNQSTRQNSKSPGNTDNKQNKKEEKKTQTFDLEDEYYDFDGF